MSVTLPGPWAMRTPDELLDEPGQIRDIGPAEAWKTLAYRDAGTDTAYDTLGHRYCASNPYRGAVPLQTLPGMLRARRLDRPRSRFRGLEREHALLRHRAIGLSPPDGSMTYEVTEDTFELFVEQVSERGVRYRDRWLFGLSHPPELLLRNAEAYDAPRTVNQLYRLDLPGAVWLPVTAVIERGRLDRFQDCRDSLTNDAPPGTLCLFVSHRWRSEKHPDPTGKEAALIVWQLVDRLFEAVMVAQRRGLNEPRLRSPLLGVPVGIAGSELTEAIVVNVLRPALDDARLEQAASEALDLEPHLGASVMASAEADVGLRNLRDLLDGRPIFGGLLERIRLWYDFACLPQPPRNAAEQQRFDQGLQSLQKIQLLGRTVILLDTPENYLSRAWCTLEAVCAEVLGQEPDLLHATFRPTAASGEVESYFHSIMQDRPHLVRRGILDTEVHGLQTPEQCFQRLGIELNDASDLPFVYESLTNLGRPYRLHVDPSSLVTGNLPIPITPRGDAVLLPEPVLEDIADRDGQPSTVDVSDVPDLSGAAAAPAHQGFDAPATDQRIHIIVVESSEGDAGLVAGWVAGRRAALENVLKATVTDISWLSDDVAPVGHLPCGKLSPFLDDADIWLIVASSLQVERGPLCRRLLVLAGCVRRRRAVLLIDHPERNLLWLPELETPTGGPIATAVKPTELDLTPIEGGVFSSALSSELLFVMREPAPEPLPLVDQVTPPENLQLFVLKSWFEGEQDLVRNICEFHTLSVFQQFESWLRMPEEFRGDPRRMQAYVAAMAFVAETMKEFGHPQPLEMLQGGDDDGDDPLKRSRDLYGKAEARENAGDYAGSCAILTSLLPELDTMQGPFVDNMRPKVLGKLSVNAFHLGRTEDAMRYARLAHQACEDVGDVEGASIYAANLQFLKEATSPSATATAIAAAQRLSDQGRYQSSNAILDPLITEMSADDPLAIKAWGLRGSNYHWLGHREAAVQDTKRAEAIAKAAGDSEGMRVYANNLALMEAGA